MPSVLEVGLKRTCGLIAADEHHSDVRRLGRSDSRAKTGLVDGLADGAGVIREARVLAVGEIGRPRQAAERTV